MNNNLVTLLSGGGAAIEALGNLAADDLYTSHNNVVANNSATQAEYLATMLRIAESQRQLLRAAQGWIVMRLVQTGLWQAHPDGYASLRGFLHGCGLGDSAVSELNTLGEYIVPYCDRHNIALDIALLPNQWGKTREILSHLRRKIRDEDPPGEIQAVLDTAAAANNRDAVRAQFRKHHKSSCIGKGAIIHRDGRALAVILLDDRDSVPVLLSHLNGTISWDLLAAQIASTNPKAIEVQVAL